MKEQPHQAEHKHRHGVLLPILLLFRLQPHDSIEKPLNRLQERIEKCFSLRIEHADKVKAHRLCQQEKNRDVKDKLNPSENIHVSSLLSKLLRPKDSEKDVSDQCQPNNDSDDVAH